MGLDIYVGTLTRYYARDWETIMQKIGREQGMQVLVVRPNDPPSPSLLDRLIFKLGLKSPPPPAPSKDEIRERVESWHRSLEASAQSQGIELKQWSEADDKPYFTDKPNWDGYGAILAWAIHAERPELEKPDKPPDVFSDDRYVEMHRDAQGRRFTTLLSGADLYLPFESHPVVQGHTPDGNERLIASTNGLLADLDQLNRETWNASPEQLDEWAKNDPEPEAGLTEFEALARFGWAVLRRLTQEAVDNGLPLKLDY